MRYWFIAALLASASSAGHAADPSFDCAKAESDAENAVCASEALAELDVETARLYQLAVAGVSGARLDELKAMQRGWIKGRDGC